MLVELMTSFTVNTSGCPRFELVESDTPPHEVVTRAWKELNETENWKFWCEIMGLFQRIYAANTKVSDSRSKESDARRRVHEDARLRTALAMGPPPSKSPAKPQVKGPRASASSSNANLDAKHSDSKGEVVLAIQPKPNTFSFVSHSLLRCHSRRCGR
jgi:hypothetical protein